MTDDKGCSPTQIFVDEEHARAFLEWCFWPEGTPVCPHCGNEGYDLSAKPASRRPGRPGLKKCRTCRKQFSVRGAMSKALRLPLSNSKLPLSKWLNYVIRARKGETIRQIAARIGCTQKTAWHLKKRFIAWADQQKASRSMSEQPETCGDDLDLPRRLDFVGTMIAIEDFSNLNKAPSETPP